MQPALNKIHSLDYSCSSGGDGGGGASSRGYQRTGSNNNPRLMHSVSIVVELAKDPAHQQQHQKRRQQQQQGSQGGHEICDDPESHEAIGRKSCNKTPLDDNSSQQQEKKGDEKIDMVNNTGSNDDSFCEHNCSSSHPLKPINRATSGSVSADDAATIADYKAAMAIAAPSMSLDEEDEENDEDGENDDDDDDDDDGGCLSSNLARKVVIVDEADKILRSRAQSAEPQRLAKELASLAQMPSPPFEGSSRTPLGKLEFGFKSRPPDPRVPPPIPARTMVGPRRRLNTIAGLTTTGDDHETTIPGTNLDGAGSHASFLGASSSCGSTCSSMTTSSDGSSATTTPSKAATSDGGGGPRSWLPSGGCGGHGELAERGELSKLSMRRNTHHYVATASSSQPAPVSSCGGGGNRKASNPMVVTNTTGGACGTTGVSLAGLRLPLNTMPMKQQPDSGNTNLVGWPNRPDKRHTRSGSAQLERGPLMQLAGRLPAGGGGYGAACSGSGSLLARRSERAFGACENSATAAAAAAQTYAPATTIYPTNQHKSTKRITQNAPTIAANKNWSQRRQSLQISLLSGVNSTVSSIGIGGGCVHSSQSKLLTEEELRGEREFNEQVRSAKSPEISALFATAAGSSGGGGGAAGNHNKLQSAGVSSGCPSTATTITATSVTLGRRCHSVTGPIPSRVGGFVSTSTTSGDCRRLESPSSLSSSASTSPTPIGSCCQTSGREEEAGKLEPLATAATASSKSGYHQQHQIVPHSIVKTHNNLQHLHQKSNSQRHTSSSSPSQRRVSFGSIDPILVRGHHQQTVGNTRASFAFHQLSPAATHHHHHHHSPNRVTSTNLTLNQSDNNNNSNNTNDISLKQGDEIDVTRSLECDNINSSNITGNRASLETNKVRTVTNNTLASPTTSYNYKTDSTCLLSAKHSKRHSVASTHSTATEASSTGIRHHHQPSIINKFMDYSTSIGASEIERGQEVNKDNKFTSLQDQDNSGNNQEKKDISNILYSKQENLSSSASVTPTTTTVAGRVRRIEANETTNMMAGSQDNVQNLGLQENSDPIEQQSDSPSFQTKMLGATNDGGNNDDHQTATTTPTARAAPSNNWTITSSTNTTTTMTSTTPTKVPTKQQAAAAISSNNNNNNKQMKDGSRVQSIMANARLRQEEFARLLEEHEQIVNEINRVETKMSNNSQTNQIKQQQPTTATTHQEQEQEGGGGGE